MRVFCNGTILALALGASVTALPPEEPKVPKAVEKTPAKSAPVVTAPVKFTTPVCEPVQIVVETSGNGVMFVPLNPKLKLFAGKLANSNEQWVWSTEPGEYTLLVYTGSADGPSPPAFILVVVGKPDPKTPDPDPKTPDPVIDAELVKKFQTALDADMKLYGADNKEFCNKLGRVYLQCAKKLDSESTIITFGDFYSITFTASVESKIPRRDMALSSVRGVIDSLGTFPPDTKLEGAEKDKAIELWTRIGSALMKASE